MQKIERYQFYGILWVFSIKNNEFNHFISYYYLSLLVKQSDGLDCLLNLKK